MGSARRASDAETLGSAGEDGQGGCSCASGDAGERVGLGCPDRKEAGEPSTRKCYWGRGINWFGSRRGVLLARSVACCGPSGSRYLKRAAAEFFDEAVRMACNKRRQPLRTWGGARLQTLANGGEPDRGPGHIRGFALSGARGRRVASDVGAASARLRRLPSRRRSKIRIVLVRTGMSGAIWPGRSKRYQSVERTYPLDIPSARRTRWWRHYRRVPPIAC